MKMFSNEATSVTQTNSLKSLVVDDRNEDDAEQLVEKLDTDMSKNLQGLSEISSSIKSLSNDKLLQKL